MDKAQMEEEWFRAQESLEEIYKTPVPRPARLIIEAQALRWRIRDIEDALRALPKTN